MRLDGLMSAPLGSSAIEAGKLAASKELGPECFLPPVPVAPQRLLPGASSSRVVGLLRVMGLHWGMSHTGVMGLAGWWDSLGWGFASRGWLGWGSQRI
jgi:hypothetical protein